MPSDPSLSSKTLGQIYSQARALSGIAPLAAPSISIDYLSPPTPALTPAPRAAPPTTKYSEAFTAAQKLDSDKSSEEASGKPVDPLIFDILLSNELNRRLKKNFGIAFVAITCAFTAVSYSIIILAAIHEWKMPASAMTALVIQGPLQMIGILYIMAKNLFPVASIEKKQTKTG